MSETEGLDAFVALLRKTRIKRRILQREVAEAIGCGGQAVVANWEAGRMRPADESLKAWAAFLDLPVPPGVQGWRTPACGTLSAYSRHLYYKEMACAACLAARREYDRRRRSS